MNPRQKSLLFEIISRFIKNATPVGSKSIDSKVSSATIRNDMTILEHEGLIIKPHISAGRIPTTAGFRFFVENRTHEETALFKIQQNQQKMKATLPNIATANNISDAVSTLAHDTKMLAFATAPHDEVVYFGLSHLLRQPEYAHDALSAAEVTDLLENYPKFCDFIKNLAITDEMRVFIGAETGLKMSCEISIIAVRWHSHGDTGIIGILGPVRMPYIKILKTLKKTVENNSLTPKILALGKARGMFLEN